MKTIISFTFIILLFLIIKPVFAGNPAPMYDAPVHLGGESQPQVKKQTTKTDSQEQTTDSTVETNKPQATETETEVEETELQDKTIPTTTSPTDPEAETEATDKEKYDF